MAKILSCLGISRLIDLSDLLEMAVVGLEHQLEAIFGASDLLVDDRHAFTVRDGQHAAGNGPRWLRGLASRATYSPPRSTPLR